VSLHEVNFLAVGAATVLAFALGALWYSPVLFARRWTAAHGFTPAQLEEMPTRATPAYIVSFVSWFVMATVLAMVGPHFGESAGLMFHTAVLLWLGFAATTGLTNNMFSGRSITVWFIDAGYQLASLTVMAVVLGSWR
jgi:hypothetical protein